MRATERSVTIEEVLARRREQNASDVDLPSPAIRRAKRVAAGATQEDFALVLHVRRNSIARYELGQREPRGDVRRRYAELLAEVSGR